MAGEQMQIPKFLAGDIILFAGEGDLYSKVGRWMMQVAPEDKTYAVHTAQFISSRKVLELGFWVRIKGVDDVLNRRFRFDPSRRRSFEVWRCRNLTGSERQALTHRALAYLNMRFGFIKFLAHTFDGLISRLARRDVFVLRRVDNGYPVCSEILATTYDKALHYRFGVPPECADPDHIHDWVANHPDEWVRIFCLEEQAQSRSAGAVTEAVHT